MSEVGEGGVRIFVKKDTRELINLLLATDRLCEILTHRPVKLAELMRLLGCDILETEVITQGIVGLCFKMAPLLEDVRKRLEGVEIRDIEDYEGEL